MYSAETSEFLDNILINATKNLVLSKNIEGHWDDIRSTALASWALRKMLDDLDSDSRVLADRIIQNANKWIVENLRKEEGGMNWESEAWDTSLAIIALTFDGKYSLEIAQASSWLRNIIDKNKHNGSMYDEVWETTLTTVALLRAEKVLRTPVKYDISWLKNILRWLCSIPSKEDTGEFVCPHYSGFLVWIRGEITSSRYLRELISTIEYNAFNEKVDAAKQWLLTSISKSSQLWSHFTFANAYTIYGISFLLPEELIPEDIIRKIIIHFKDFQDLGGGGFEDIEDTSLAILGLQALREKRFSTAINLSINLIEQKSYPNGLKSLNIHSNLEPADLPYPTKITLLWLEKYVPIRFWFYFIGLLLSAYLLGSEIGPNDPLTRLIIWFKEKHI